jgi:AraC-like DNA-binding protein
MDGFLILPDRAGLVRLDYSLTIRHKEPAERRNRVEIVQMSDAAAPDQGPDLLSDVLGGLQLRTTALATFEFTAPWGMRVDAFGPAFFYAVITGSLHLEMEGEAPLVMHAGDVFLTPGGDGCDLRSSPGAPLAEMTSVFDADTQLWTPGARLGQPVRAHHGGGGEPTHILAVLLDFAEGDRHPLGLNLPRLVHLRGDEGRTTPWLAPAVQAIVDEAQVGRLGYFAMATRLAELLFINTVRTHLILRPQDATGWLRGLSDARIARALSAVHRAPAESWSVEQLAKEAGMSRSAFAERFQRLIGQTPFDYVTQWRMRLARDWIASGRRSVKACALALGYASEKAFSQAFRRTLGAPPSSFRPGAKVLSG